MEHTPTPKKTVKDPICGQDVVPGTARGWDYLYQEIVYHFCGSECRSRFGANPQAGLASGPGAVSAVPAVFAPSASEPRRSAFMDLIKAWWKRRF